MVCKPSNRQKPSQLGPVHATQLLAAVLCVLYCIASTNPNLCLPRHAFVCSVFDVQKHYWGSTIIAQGFRALYMDR